MPSETKRKSRYRLRQGDCVQVLKKYKDNTFDSVVCDPPYLLGFMGKKWDMAKDQRKWHRRWLKQVLRVLKPGGYLLAFGGSRTYHNLACAAETVGFEIRDSLMWLYLQGFPHSRNIAKDIEAAGEDDSNYKGQGTALKPAYEPIVMARKPLDGATYANVLEYGTGALNIEACRIDVGKSIPINVLETWSGFGQEQQPDYKTEWNDKGLWPANVVLSSDVDVRSYFYCAKPSKLEKDAGMDKFKVFTGGEATDRKEGSAGATNPRSGAGRGGTLRNAHPTVKPVALMQWLVRMVTPKNGRVLDPFAGSGTCGMACMVEGFRYTGIELDSEDIGYLKWSKARIEWAHKHRRRLRKESLPDVVKSTKKSKAFKRTLFGG